MFRFLIFALILAPLPAYGFDLGTYECSVQAQTGIVNGPGGVPVSKWTAPRIEGFRLKLEPFRGSKHCMGEWGQGEDPQRCNAQYQAVFDPPLVPGEATLYGLAPEDPDIYHGKSSFVHFTDNILYQAAWSIYGAAYLARGECARVSAAND